MTREKVKTTSDDEVSRIICIWMGVVIINITA